MKKYFQPFMNLFASGYVVIMHSKITFSIARNVIMIGLLSKWRLRDGVATLVCMSNFVILCHVVKSTGTCISDG